MQFYNREKELEKLTLIRSRSLVHAQMTVLVGRRRIGKTRLILESLKDERFLYFFIARKEERLLCEEFSEQIRSRLSLPIFGEINSFRDLFALLMEASKTQPFTLVIDEFQEFERVNPAIFSEMQQIWDLNREQSRLNLIVSGSVYSLMRRIFEHAKEPLFGRANERMFIKPFPVDVLRQIMQELRPGYAPKDLLSFYLLTGGVPKYVEWYAERNLLGHEEMMDAFFQQDSLFLEEGKNLLVEEFGKDYGVYFSILALIASSKTSRPEIESVLQKDIGGFLLRLETDYQVIRRVQPIFSKPGTRNLKYQIVDPFLRFWFRFVYKYQATLEMGNFAYLKTLVDRDFSTFAGPGLERFFHEQLSASGQYSQIGHYWEKGNQNEIDLVAVNELEKRALIAEIKMSPRYFSPEKLRQSAEKLLAQLPGYHIEFRSLSLEDLIGPL